MRNFIIAGAVLGTATGIAVYERSTLGHTRQASSALVKQSKELNREIASEREGIAELEERLKKQQANLAQVQSEIQRERAAREPIVAQNPTPSQEGFWPAARPYFYLAKQHIPGIEFPAFGPAAGVSEEAGALFGMSSVERSQIQMVMQRLFDQIKERELKSATLTKTPPDAMGRPGQKISIRLPANPEAAQLYEQASASISEVLGGGQRAALFLERAREEARRFESLSSEERVVTFIPKDDMSGEVIVSNRLGSSYNYYDFSRPQDWVSFQYGHLLGAFLPRDLEFQTAGGALDPN